MIACIPLVKFLDYMVQRGSFSWAAEMNDGIIEITGIVLLVMMLAIMIYAKMGKQKRVGVPCPRCQTPLSGRSAQIAIATRSCPYCGENILD